MHLSQTKSGSIKSGGPQYFLHSLTEEVQKFIEEQREVSVALVTPYGATKTNYTAIHKNWKRDRKSEQGDLVKANAQHHRIQQGGAEESIGEAIRKWYRLPNGVFEQIDIDIIVRDQEFYLTPLVCVYRSGNKQTLDLIERPLTFTHSYPSVFWCRQMEAVEKQTPGVVRWALSEICRIMADHKPPRAHIQETDILRAAGALKLLGMEMGAYLGRGLDCETKFQFLEYPEYTVPVEVKKNSKNFHYQESKYPTKELSRVVVLCATHNHRRLQPHIDVIELDALCAYSSRLPLFANLTGG